MPCSRLLLSQPSKISNSFLFRLQTRTVRTKRGSGYYDNSLKRDERLLRRLEADLANVQERIKREEKEAASLLKHFKNRGSAQNTPGLDDLHKHDTFFWEKVLNRDDRQLLAKHGINSLEALSSAYDTAEKELSQSTHLKVEDLDPKSKCAYEVYQNIPLRLHAAGRNKAGSWFGDWF
ncbi:hypothetical protein AX17_000934 [Amanita inopinata Kibby_2008]|nr:hypothetical protein AX17_000934 [Amanita inopinata Kibby_2008]